MFNKIILIGNLVKTPELRYTPNGTAVTTMRLAVTSKYKQGNETKDDTLFIDAVTFGKQAESCGQYLDKGNSVLVEGRLREKKWESDGVQKNKFEVIVNAVRFLSKRNSEIDDTGIPRSDITDSDPF